MIIKLPNGDWVDPLLISRICAFPKDDYGKDRMIAYSDGSAFMLECETLKEAQEAREKLASQVQNAWAAHDARLLSVGKDGKHG